MLNTLALLLTLTNVGLSYSSGYLGTASHGAVVHAVDTSHAENTKAPTQQSDSDVVWFARQHNKDRTGERTVCGARVDGRTEADLARLKNDIVRPSNTNARRISVS